MLCCSGNIINCLSSNLVSILTGKGLPAQMPRVSRLEAFFLMYGPPCYFPARCHQSSLSFDLMTATLKNSARYWGWSTEAAPMYHTTIKVCVLAKRESNKIMCAAYSYCTSVSLYSVTIWLWTAYYATKITSNNQDTVKLPCFLFCHGNCE